MPEGFIENIVGLAADQVMAYDYKYDGNGKIVLDANGIPARGLLKPWGSAYSKWIAGWSNDFVYKNFHLSVLIDGKFGGKLFSASNLESYIYGLNKATLVNREGTFGNNIDAQTYYQTLAVNVTKLFVEDASFIKFRQVIFGYNFPASFFHKVVKGASFNLVAKNLFFLMRKSKNIDPEGDITPNAFGLEYGELPGTRSYGFNLNIKF